MAGRIRKHVDVGDERPRRIVPHRAVKAQGYTLDPLEGRAGPKRPERFGKRNLALAAHNVVQERVVGEYRLGVEAHMGPAHHGHYFGIFFLIVAKYRKGSFYVHCDGGGPHYIRTDRVERLPRAFPRVGLDDVVLHRHLHPFALEVGRKRYDAEGRRGRLLERIRRIYKQNFHWRFLCRVIEAV
ncbi:MAG: hypothetical protein BWY96_02147 [Spirochaetes bacterium ADurb.BinA120]|nr:MAG: hypothetical protein BWY96_02147 [Spirochaetes bacterium ADurb.BinA120]